ncbi:hypothetical protein DNTS_031661 [Danionella cerebrum]|uniref:non-specific serine/threonine protein kinase n=1 Tax=Danionella cerebrum TaxID=2873325 RepID=A0A553PVN7_9TELE|nr:hypothetical protein DNTS_031661 [Danionella translucida]
MSVNNALKGMGYTSMKMIGEGSFSKVKLASSQKHCCNVAIKIVDRIKAPQDFVKKFLPRELAVLKRVNHENIIQMHEFIEVAGKQLCIVMEAASKDLLQKIEEVKRIQMDQCKSMFSQMTSAVNYLHQMNIVHRDLKCENILLTSDEQVKITDFGFARFVEDPSELSRTFCGSRAYAPPEVIMGTPYEPKKFDVWSIGVVLYVMVTGTMPYDDDGSLKQLLKCQKMPLSYSDDAGVEDLCKTFIGFLLQTNPAERPTIQQVAQHPWLQARPS